MARPILLDEDGNPVYNAGVDLQQMIDELPAGVERAMLRILNFHVGRESAISRSQLVNDLYSHGFQINERSARLVINQLRKQGIEICSTGGSDGGYWLAVNQDELEEYIQLEIDARINDLVAQARAMRSAAEKRGGRYSPAKQASMFAQSR